MTFANTAPVAGNDSITVSPGQRTVINIGANDSDANNDELTTSGVTNPTKGSVSYTNNTGAPDTATYTPLLMQVVQTVLRIVCLTVRAAQIQQRLP